MSLFVFVMNAWLSLHWDWKQQVSLVSPDVLKATCTWQNCVPKLLPIQLNCIFTTSSSEMYLLLTVGCTNISLNHDSDMYFTQITSFWFGVIVKVYFKWTINDLWSSSVSWFTLKNTKPKIQGPRHISFLFLVALSLMFGVSTFLHYVACSVRESWLLMTCGFLCR